jgi:hypothetical protein
MPFDKTGIRKGARLTGAAHPVEGPRRSRIKKGIFLISTPSRVGATPLAVRLGEIDRQYAIGIAVIAARLQAVRDQLDAIKKTRK